MKFLYTYLKKYIPRISFVMAVKLIAAVGELLLPYILEYLIDEVAPSGQVSAAVLWGVIMIVLALLVRFLNVFANRNGADIARKSTYEIRRDLFWHSVNLSGSQMDSFGLPSITSRMTSDSYNVQNFVRAMMAMGVRAPILLLGGICITLTMDTGLALILCIIAPIVITAIVCISLKGIPLYAAVQRRLDTVVRIMRENITGIRVVKALSKERYEMNRFAGSNASLTADERKAGIIMAMPGPIMTFFLNVGLTLVVVVGAHRVNAGVTKPGVILAFLTYFNMILMGAMGINRIFMMMSKANASANRIAEVIRTPDDLAPIPEEKAAHTEDPAFIRFDHVSFRYGENSTVETGVQFDGESRQMSLCDVDFAIQKGGSLGIIGATGCGKTTVVNLLMRFYDATQGSVFVDGRDVRTYDRDTLHRMFGVVFQNDVVFADTIAENIRFGRAVTDEDMESAAKDARGAEFIEEYEDRYDHRASIGGANFSGGQRQRILISRALAADPRILVLDDASSALDYKTDAALRKAIRERYSDVTTIIIAQRISSIMTLDNILMLEDGKVIGYGSHEHLLQTCPAYREIFEAQMGEGE